METNYSLVAQDYADNVRALFAISTEGAAPDRGAGELRSSEELATQAEKLAGKSDALTKEAEKVLVTNLDPDKLGETVTQLMAKALTDLRISARLLEVAAGEGEEALRQRGAIERSAGDGSTEELLQVITGARPVALTDRSIVTSKALESARTELLQTIDDTLALISTRTSKTGQAAVTGLFGIGLGQVGQAAGLLGQNVAQALGQAGTLSRWYGYVVDFALKAYDSVIAALGPTVSKIAGQKVLDWFAEVKEAKFFGRVLEQMYGTKKTQEELVPIINQSTAQSEDFTAATQKLVKLGDLCSYQLGLIDKLLKGVKFLGAIPVAILPYGALLMALFYVSTCAYVVLSGADYVDAETIKLLDRVPGVRQIVITSILISSVSDGIPQPQS
jgi:hypothetical protein